MSKYTNDYKIPLSVAAWLATDSYDFKSDTNQLSATDFNRSIRQIILRNRMASRASVMLKSDVSYLIKSKLGTSCHDALEQFWLDPDKFKQGMLNLGYSPKDIRRIRVNPHPADIKKLNDPNIIPVYLERRGQISIDGYTISGKFDFVAEGKLTDFKTTGTWKWSNIMDMASSANEDYKIQGSIYRLIHKDIITQGTMSLVFIFNDWIANRANNPNYPKYPCVSHEVALMSPYETYKMIKKFLADLEAYKDAPESEIPLCSDKHLWKTTTTYKYYKNPAKKQRATKVFTNYLDAQKQFYQDNGVGEIVTIHGEAKACKTCPAASICSQRDKLFLLSLSKNR